MVRRLKTWMLGLSAVALISLSILSYIDVPANLAQQKNCYCYTTQAVQQEMLQCKREAHTSWFAWLTGKSSSAQFHYLDLLELMLGSKNTSDTFPTEL